VRVRTACAPLVLLLGMGCAWWPWGNKGPWGDPEFGVEVVTFDGVTEFHSRALAFYERLSYRRVNTYATYQDQVLREYFETPEAFDDYYASLASSLDAAVFEQNRPIGVEVAEFYFDAPGEATVRVRFVGYDGMPLRPGKTHSRRDDRWERRDGRWWIVPSNL
jgi:hypothetical protein